MWYRGGRAEESDPTEVHIQLIREEEVLDDKSESLPQVDDLEPSIESTKSDVIKSVNVCSERIMKSRGEQADEYDPTEVQIHSSREEELLDEKADSLPLVEDFKPDTESTNGVAT